MKNCEYYEELIGAAIDGEITAEEDGVISEVCVANGQVVEYGTELFRIRR